MSHRSLISFPSNVDSVYFLELTDRQQIGALSLCALESAAKHNPNSTVFLLRTASNPVEWSDPLSVVSSRYANIKFRQISVRDLMFETPLMELWESGRIDKSRHFVSHLSDVIRVGLLLKFGGVYMDTDVITLKQLPPPTAVQNFVVLEEPGSINGAILKFQPQNEMLLKVAERLSIYTIMYTGK